MVTGVKTSPNFGVHEHDNLANAGEKAHTKKVKNRWQKVRMLQSWNLLKKIKGEN